MSSQATRCVAVTVRGVVQGVGFRPFVYHAACSRGLSGWVRNEADTVRIEARGPAEAVAAFLVALRCQPPPQARVDTVEVVELSTVDRPAGDTKPGGFQIRSSPRGAAPQPTIPADLATCAACRAEIRDPQQRRHGYPFTNCTNCGPRWSIIAELPYDRPRTSMAGFALCPDCRAEYDDPADRRFHAQPIACPRCGPKLALLDPQGKLVSEKEEALAAATRAILDGEIVALRGLGGFQLLVDATQDEAVLRLRQRKRRPDRPLAVMFPSIEAIRECCEVSEEEERALMSAAAPILLLRTHKREECQVGNWEFGIRNSEREFPNSEFRIPNSVAPHNPYLGAMLPNTPLHYLLLAAVGRPVVCTSGNLSEEPMAIDTDEALRRLGPIADWVLTHDRPIVRPVDDSVARLGPEGLQVLRRARGYAPLPIALSFAAPTILAVGGHLKNTVALAIGRAAAPTPIVLSQHVGDLDSVLSIDVFRRAIDDLVGFFRARPERIACDLHPDYASTRTAEALAEQWDVPLVRVQHHHAHVAACMAEHGLDRPVLGLAWDGTGYGTDGTVWGGEFLVCHGSGFRRAAHLRTFALPGGDRAMRQPRRSALGLVFEILGDAAADELAAHFEPAEMKTLLGMLHRRLNSPRTSSLGRLFDAVAALCGLGNTITFEGQAAMALEFAAEENIEESYSIPLVGPVDSDVPANPQAEIIPFADWEPALRAILADRRAGVPGGRISARFHAALAELAVAVARHVGLPDIVLSGGCFQNALLGRQVRDRLLATGYNVWIPRQVPPGDGGIALGQVYVAAKQK